MTRRPLLTVLSAHGDLHGLLVAEALARLRGGDLDCRIVELDCANRDGGLAWEFGPEGARLRLKDVDGAWFDPAESDLIWCRRFSRPQRGDTPDGYLTAQWRQTVRVLADLPGPAWMDHPDVILPAESKPRQLQAAAHAGFRVPETLVSHDPAAIRAFHTRCEGEVIVKPVKGHIGRQLMTVKLPPEALAEASGLAAFPAIYQRCIPGDRHLRVVVLPGSVHGFEITSSALDWRQKDGLRIRPVPLETDLVTRCRATLQGLGLSMGSFDLKIDPERQIWFLEVNPQGQFFFLQMLTGVDLATPYARALDTMLPKARMVA